jgi:elongation factor G
VRFGAQEQGRAVDADKAVELLRPLDIPPVHGLHPKTDEELVRHADTEPTARSFKILTDPYVDSSAFPCLFGHCQSRFDDAQQHEGDRKRMDVVRMFADTREDIEEVRAGDIGAIPR